ncbi:hypothetical protein D3C87_2000880 [compost metagenome]
MACTDRVLQRRSDMILTQQPFNQCLRTPAIRLVNTQSRNGLYDVMNILQEIQDNKKGPPLR